jgi:hypothetical protein
VWLGGKKDMNSHQQLDLVVRHWQALEDRREELGPGPWSVTLAGWWPLTAGLVASTLSALDGTESSMDLVHWSVH